MGHEPHDLHEPAGQTQDPPNFTSDPPLRVLPQIDFCDYGKYFFPKIDSSAGSPLSSFNLVLWKLSLLPTSLSVNGRRQVLHDF